MVKWFVVLVDRLHQAVARINPDLPTDAVQERACELAMTGTSPSLIEDHRGFHELLTSGVPIPYVDDAGVEQAERAELVDFENPVRNELLAVNQFTIVEGGHNRRPDILLFVNGLPLGQLELKAPGLAESAQGGDQSDPPLHRHDSQPLPLSWDRRCVGPDVGACLGTWSTAAEHFAEWKEMGAADRQPHGRSPLQAMIEGVFSPAHLLELIRDFVLFESDGARTWEVMAKYHQVDAVHAAVESVAVAMGGDRRGGMGASGRRQELHDGVLRQQAAA